MNPEVGSKIQLSAVPSWIEAEASGQPKGPPKFSLVAYTGGAMRLAGFDHPVVVDLTGLKFNQRIPTRREHWGTIGHTEAITLKDWKLSASGVLSFDNESAREVAIAGRNGFPWQASMGATIHRRDLIASGERVTVNGQEFTGPVIVVRASELDEISFVDLGADRNTSASVAAKAANKEPSDMDEKTKPTPAGDAVVTGTAPANAVPAPQPDPVAALRASTAAEHDRIAAVQKAAAGFPEIAATAVRDGWSAEKTQLASTRAELDKLRAERPAAPNLNLMAPAAGEDVLCAAAVEALGGLRDVEKKFKPETLDAAHTRFKGKITLHQIITMCAAAAGRIVTNVAADYMGSLKAGFTTMSLPNLFANVQNKYLASGFFSVEGMEDWPKIAGIRSLKDFKPASGVRFGGNFKLKPLSSAGEIQHGTFSEKTYSNQVGTRALTIAITRESIINDDLGALSDIPRHMGRGAALDFLEAFWTEWLENAGPFYSVGNGNFDSGADTAMSIESIGAMLTLQAKQTDYDGNPIGIGLKTLVFPPELWNVAFPSLMSSVITIGGTAEVRGMNNPVAGKLVPLQSSYLSSAAIAGSSATAFFGVADPLDTPVIEVGFLNGVRVPTIESEDTVFDSPGVQTRILWDWGIKKQEKKAAIKFAGA